MTALPCPHSVLGAVIGHQDNGDGGLLELRNCCGCRSTVSREVTRAEVLGASCACSTCRSLRAPTWVGREFALIREARRRERARLAQAAANRERTRGAA